jgi:hypothetical protein
MMVDEAGEDDTSRWVSWLTKGPPVGRLGR